MCVSYLKEKSYDLQIWKTVEEILVILLILRNIITYTFKNYRSIHGVDVLHMKNIRKIKRKIEKRRIHFSEQEFFLKKPLKREVPHVTTVSQAPCDGF